MLTLIVHLRATPASVVTGQATLQDLIASTRQSEGNLEFQVFQNQKDPLQFTLFEKWQDQAALAAHDASAEMQAFNQQKATLFPEVSAELVTELTPTKN